MGEIINFEDRKRIITLRKAPPVQSYVISVSQGTGCYRHIRIGANETLFALHEAIMDAFEFIDDHAHAFFMNNHFWDEEYSYYSDMIEDEERFTCDFTLSDMDLQADSKFAYIFDFGDEWRFSCKVLKVLDEQTEKPCVIHSKGEAPSQFKRESVDEDLDGDDEDSGEDK